MKLRQIADAQALRSARNRDRLEPDTTTADDDLQAATIELMHSISRLAVATFANDLINRANDAHLYEFANIITDALHDYAGPSR